MFAAVLAAVALVAAHAPERPAPMQHARGTFVVKITPAGTIHGMPDDKPGRMTLDKTFSGDLVGTGRGEMLGLIGPEQAGAYVAVERVTATLNGREGSFALVHRGVMQAGKQDLSITVVPGSGTGALAGIEGTFDLKIEAGVHRYDLAYTLPGEVSP